jgi:hypothetical protein
MTRATQTLARLLLFALATMAPTAAWITSLPKPAVSRATAPSMNSSPSRLQSKKSNDLGKLVASVFLASTIVIGAPAALADEIGVERDAPTLFTGENVMICKKRGPLGACLESVVRTESNDNDKAKQYFRDPSEIVRQKEATLRAAAEETQGNALIEKLRQQTEDNKEKNRLTVERKTFENDQSASFGPFDRQVVIMNTDGRTFTLLENPQAMRLKKAGFIEGRQFVKQPTKEDIAAALEPDGPGLAGALLGVFGKNNNAN